MTIFNYTEMRLSYERFLKYHGYNSGTREASNAFDRFLHVPPHDTMWWNDRYKSNDSWDVPDYVAYKITNLISPHWYALMKAMIANEEGEGKLPRLL